MFWHQSEKSVLSVREHLASLSGSTRFVLDWFYSFAPCSYLTWKAESGSPYSSPIGPCAKNLTIQRVWFDYLVAFFDLRLWKNMTVKLAPERLRNSPEGCVLFLEKPPGEAYLRWQDRRDIKLSPRCFKVHFQSRARRAFGKNLLILYMSIIPFEIQAVDLQNHGLENMFSFDFLV